MKCSLQGSAEIKKKLPGWHPAGGKKKRRGSKLNAGPANYERGKRYGESKVSRRSRVQWITKKNSITKSRRERHATEIELVGGERFSESGEKRLAYT